MRASSSTLNSACRSASTPTSASGLRARGARTILLERRRAGEAELPADRDLALCVDVRAFPLPDVFAWIQTARASRAFCSSATKTTRSRSGCIAANSCSRRRISASTDSATRSCARARSRSSSCARPSAAFAAANASARRSSSAGSSRRASCGTACSDRSRRSCARSSRTPAGLAYFWDGEVQPDNVVRLHLSTQRLVAEGMRWRDDLRRFVAALSDPRVRIESVAARRDGTSGIERLLVDALAEESAFLPLCRRVGTRRADGRPHAPAPAPRRRTAYPARLGRSGPHPARAAP